MNNANSNFKKGKKHIEAYIFFLIAALVVTGCSDAQTTADLIDKWNQIIVVQEKLVGEVTNATTFNDLSTAAFDNVKNLDELSNALENYSRDFDTATNATVNLLQKAQEDVIKESTLISEFSALSVQLKDEEAKRYAEDAAKFLREHNSKMMNCINELSSMLLSINGKYQQMSATTVAKLEFLEEKVELGESVEEDYNNLLKEIDETTIGLYDLKDPASCEESDILLQRAQDSISKAGALQ